MGFLFIGPTLAARAGEIGYYDAGVIQVIYIVITPLMLFGVAMVGESWVASLPSQVPHSSVYSTAFVCRNNVAWLKLNKISWPLEERNAFGRGLFVSSLVRRECIVSVHKCCSAPMRCLDSRLGPRLNKKQTLRFIFILRRCNTLFRCPITTEYNQLYLLLRGASGSCFRKVSQKKHLQ